MAAKFLSAIASGKPTGRQLLVLLTVLLAVLGWGLPNFLPFSHPAYFYLFLPLGVSALISAILGYGIVPILRQYRASQIIQEDGPQTHLQKAGTPTMGGIFFVPVALAISAFVSGFDPAVVAVGLTTLGYMAIGWYDDWQILCQQSNKGITPRTKLILQISVAILFCLWVMASQPPEITQVRLIGRIVLPLGFFFWILAGFALVAESNATNLTDGVDGLAAGTCALAFLGLGVLTLTAMPNLTLFCAAMAGGCLGFLVHNRNPATVFMGDTGSLALGGALGAVGVMSGHLWGLLIVSGIFLAESLSVIAQVSYYKATKGPDGKGRRLFKMAPLHHHLELSGWAETQIVGFFYLINALLVLLAVSSQLAF